MAVNLIALSVQTVGTLLVAALLWQLTRVIGGRYLRYWAAGWTALTVALFALRAAVAPELPPGVRVPARAVYCVGSSLFGYFVWAGFRNFARGRPAARADLWVLAPAALLIVHTPLTALFFALALAETFRAPAPDGLTEGLYVARVTLLLLALLFAHYGAVAAWAVHVARARPTDALPYLQLAPVYNAFVQFGLAFGVVLLATERVRDELAAKNRQLAAATEQLARAARSDALTGLLNRRAYEELLAEQAGRPFAGSLAIIDLNDLKRLNDTRGHAAGDAALQLVARALRIYFRVTDPVFRMGGDEFLIVLPGGSAADAAGRMTRIDQALRAQRLPGAPDPVDLAVAWGVAEFATGDALPAAVAAADRAMYERKPAGRQTRDTRHETRDTT